MLNVEFLLNVAELRESKGQRGSAATEEPTDLVRKGEGVGEVSLPDCALVLAEFGDSVEGRAVEEVASPSCDAHRSDVAFSCSPRQIGRASCRERVS